jgi:hypothetical protein
MTIIYTYNKISVGSHAAGFETEASSRQHFLHKVFLQLLHLFARPGTPRKNVALVQKSRNTSVEWSFFAGCPCITFRASHVLVTNDALCGTVIRPSGNRIPFFYRRLSSRSGDVVPWGEHLAALLCFSVVQYMGHPTKPAATQI